MTHFILLDRDLKRFPNFLLDEVTEFVQAKEFRDMDPKDVLVPGLLCAAFTRYFVRLNQEAVVGGPDANVNSRIAACYAAVEKIARSPDPEVCNLAVVEVFENLDCPNSMLDAIESNLGPTSKALYKRWIKDSPA